MRLVRLAERIDVPKPPGISRLPLAQDPNTMHSEKWVGMGPPRIEMYLPVPSSAGPQPHPHIGTSFPGLPRPVSHHTNVGMEPSLLGHVFAGP